MKPLKFIHAADLHIDSPFVGLKHLPGPLFDRIRESTFVAFKKLIDCAIEEKVDFVLLVGDLYDGEERSLKAQLKLKNEFQRLHAVGIPVYIIHGNHDHMSGKWIDLDWSSNVHIFSSEEVETKLFFKDEVHTASLYGYSYPTRAVHERIISNFKKQQTEEKVYHIGLLHGSIEGNHEHDTYCPFKLTELVEKDFDYWALGHIHKRQNLQEQEPMIVYPGNLQGRHRKENGEKGFYITRINENKTSLEFISASDVIWEEVEIKIDEMKDFSQFIKECELKLAHLRKEKQGTLLTIIVKGVGPVAEHIQNEQAVLDLIERLNESEDLNENFVWTASLKNYSNRELTEQELSTSFFKDLKNTVEEFHDYSRALEPLTQHSLYRRYIQAFTEEEKKDMLKDAELLLFYGLLYHQEK
ncbi:exonuclease SbcCD subunit D [Metabacillus herbersteinensis]|uniref:Exonuclease SbcCD subunit D n=1 Tax=Metabacillus herbersteinensis TaxID=283816 RepID=A0ABV6GEH4_9BACI